MLSVGKLYDRPPYRLSTTSGEQCKHKTSIHLKASAAAAAMSAKHVGSKVAHSLKWIRLETITYIDEEGKERRWEMAARTTRYKKYRV